MWMVFGIMHIGRSANESNRLTGNLSAMTPRNHAKTQVNRWIKAWYWWWKTNDQCAR